MVQDERHGIFFCGYIDSDTLGYRVFHSNPGEAFVFSTAEDPVTVINSNIKRFYLSSHADRYELLEIARRLHPRITLLVHGERNGMEFMREQLGKESQIFLGERGKTIILD